MNTRRRMLLILAAVTLLLAGFILRVAVGQRDRERLSSLPGTEEEEVQRETGGSKSGTEVKEPDGETSGNEETSGGESKEEADESQRQVLFKEILDLDNDGEAEIVQIEKDTAQEGEGSQAGFFLKIMSQSGEATLVDEPIRNSSHLVNVFSEAKIIDLNSDGSKDVFLVVPVVGSSFIVNNFYMYDFKNRRSYSFPWDGLDFNIGSFVAGFEFEYKGEGILSVKNKAYGYEGTIDLSSRDGFSVSKEEGFGYNSSWVDPTPVEINSDTRLKLVEEETGSPVLIKMPLPVFGHAAVDLLAKVDLYFEVNENFRPSFVKFELVPF